MFDSIDLHTIEESGYKYKMDASFYFFNLEEKHKYLYYRTLEGAERQAYIIVHAWEPCFCGLSSGMLYWKQCFSAQCVACGLLLNPDDVSADYGLQHIINK